MKTALEMYFLLKISSKIFIVMINVVKVYREAHTRLAHCSLSGREAHAYKTEGHPPTDVTHAIASSVMY